MRSVVDRSNVPLALPVSERKVTQVRIDYHLGLHFDSGGLLSIGGVATLRFGERDQTVEPDRQVNVLAAIDLLWDTVTTADASPDGSLTVEFASGRTLFIPNADADYEPWEFVDESGDVRVVSLPGGGLATWGDRS